MGGTSWEQGWKWRKSAYYSASPAIKIISVSVVAPSQFVTSTGEHLQFCPQPRSTCLALCHSSPLSHQFPFAKTAVSLLPCFTRHIWLALCFPKLCPLSIFASACSSIINRSLYELRILCSCSWLHIWTQLGFFSLGFPSILRSDGWPCIQVTCYFGLGKCLS